MEEKDLMTLQEALEEVEHYENIANKMVMNILVRAIDEIKSFPFYQLKELLECGKRIDLNPEDALKLLMSSDNLDLDKSFETNNITCGYKNYEVSQEFKGFKRNSKDEVVFDDSGSYHIELRSW